MLFNKNGESMIRRLLLTAVLGVALSGCYMAPLALVGPITSGYSTASLIQTGLTSGTNYLVKRSTGKTIAEHALETINSDIFKQTYVPKDQQINVTKDKFKKKLKKKYTPHNKFSAQCKKYDFYCKRMLNKNPAKRSTLLKNEVNLGCKKFDFYCKRMSQKKWLQHVNQNQSLLGSS